MNLGRLVSIVGSFVFLASVFFASGAHAADKSKGTAVYDEAAYTEYVQKTMKKLDKLYLEFCGTCGVEGASAEKAKREYLETVRDLMQHMNARFDNMDPKAGAALSPTETLISIHVLTMLVDMLTASYLEEVADHPHNL